MLALKNRIARYANKYASDVMDADELIQIGYLAALEALPQFKGESSESTFAITCARNAMLNAALDVQAENAVLDPVEIESLDVPAPDSSNSPEDLYIAAELAPFRENNLAAAKAALPERNRRIVNRRLAGAAWRDIAEAEGLGLSAVQANHAQSIKRMARLMGAA